DCKTGSYLQGAPLSVPNWWTAREAKTLIAPSRFNVTSPARQISPIPPAPIRPRESRSHLNIRTGAAATNGKDKARKCHFRMASLVASGMTRISRDRCDEFFLLALCELGRYLYIYCRVRGYEAYDSICRTSTQRREIRCDRGRRFCRPALCTQAGRESECSGHVARQEQLSAIPAAALPGSKRTARPQQHSFQFARRSQEISKY